MSRKVTLGEVERGEVSLEALMDLNSLLDMTQAMQENEAEEAQAQAENRKRVR